MDAFSEFDRLVREPAGPFAYLKKTDAYPSNVRYPLFSIARKGWDFRIAQNYSVRVDRRFNWPTVAGISDGLTRQDLANVSQRQMPMAWNYTYQLDHYAMNPESQALFTERLFRVIAHSTAAQPQAFLLTSVPGYGDVKVRTTFNNPSDVSEREPGDQMMVYRTTLEITMEGWSYDFDQVIIPTVWNAIINAKGIAPDDIETLVNLRLHPDANATFHGDPLPATA
jgi:hypothetical protein